MWFRKYQVIATHKHTNEKSVVFTGSKNACTEKIFHLLAAKMDRPDEEINGESIWNFNFSIEKKKRK